MDHYQNPRFVRDSVGPASILDRGVTCVCKGQRQCIPKNADRLVERYTVFQQIARGLLIIPFELEHAQYLEGLT